MNIIDYITEEVNRQGHDTTTKDGLYRVSWMLDAWATSINISEVSPLPTIRDMIRIGKTIEPFKNMNGIRTVGVRVGLNSCPYPSEVMPKLTRLWEFVGKITPLEFYKEFELIHPFVDGNGRTGKILMAWLDKRLCFGPIFPPNDLFGKYITNP